MLLGVGGVALILVIPINQINRAVRAFLQIHNLRPAIIEADGVRGMMADKARAAAFQHIHVQARAVDVIHQNFSTELGGPVVALINHQARVSVAAAELRAAGDVRLIPLIARVVQMVGDGFDVVVGVRIEMRTRLSLVTSALDHVKQMWNHTRLDNALPVFVEVNAPRIARALGENLEDMFRRMITPDTGVDARPLAVRRSGFADVGMCEHTMTTVKPAVRSPLERVQRLVRILPAPAVEKDLRFACGLRFIAIRNRNEHQIRRGSDPDAAEANFDSADEI